MDRPSNEIIHQFVKLFRCHYKVQFPYQRMTFQRGALHLIVAILYFVLFEDITMIEDGIRQKLF